MSVQEQILQSLCTIIDALGNFASVSYGALGAENSLALIPKDGCVKETTLGSGGLYSIDLSLDAKHTSQATARETLQLIHEYLGQLSTYSTGTNWAVAGITTLTAPAYVEHDETYWTYGSTLNMQYIID